MQRQEDCENAHKLLIEAAAARDRAEKALTDAHVPYKGGVGAPGGKDKSAWDAWEVACNGNKHCKEASETADEKEAAGRLELMRIAYAEYDEAFSVGSRESSTAHRRLRRGQTNTPPARATLRCIPPVFSCTRSY